MSELGGGTVIMFRLQTSTHQEELQVRKRCVQATADPMLLPHPAAVTSLAHFELLADPDAIARSYVLQVLERVTQGAAPFVHPVAQQHCHDQVCR